MEENGHLTLVGGEGLTYEELSIVLRRLQGELTNQAMLQARMPDKMKEIMLARR